MAADAEGTILYMARDGSLAAALAECYRVGTPIVVPTYPLGLQVLRSAAADIYAVIVSDGLALNHSQGDCVATVHEIRQTYKDVLVVVVTENASLTVREADGTVLARTGQEAQAADEIAKLLSLEPKVAARARTYGFVSNKGGEGKSSVAMGTTLALLDVLGKRAQRDKRPAPRGLIWDLDLTDGDVDLLAGVGLGLDDEDGEQVEMKLPDLLALLDTRTMTEARIRQHIVASKAGVDLLLAPLDLGALMALEKTEFLQLRGRLVEWYDIVAFDHNSQMDWQVNLESLATCDVVVVVMTPTRHGVRGMKRLLPTLDGVVDRSRLRLVLNMGLPEDRGLLPKIEARFQVPVLGMIPTGSDEIRDFRRAQAKGQAVPMRGKVWDAFLKIAEKLAAELPGSKR